MTAALSDGPSEPSHRVVLNDRLRSLVDAPQRRSRPLAVLYGDPGHGKSTMLADIVRHAGERGHLVVSMHSDTPDSEIPYAGLHSLISRNLGLLDRLDDPASRLLRQVLVDFTPPDSALAMCAAIGAWFDCLAPGSPLVVAVDDADQMDEQSLRVLAFVAARQEPGRASIILTATEPIPLFERIGAERFHLEDLEPHHARDVVLELGGSSDRATTLVRRLGGNPMALQHATRATEGSVISDADPIDVPTRLEYEVARRTAELSPSARQLLEVAAATNAVSVAALDGWCRSVGEGPVAGMLSAAESVGLVTFDGTAMAWRRGWMAEATLRRCPEGRRKRLRDELQSAWHPSRSAASTPGLERLSPGERRVVDELVAGASTREAATRLVLSEKTIESHIQSIYRKLEIHSRSQLTALALGRVPAPSFTS